MELKAAGLNARARLEVSKLRVLLAAARALARHHSVPQVRAGMQWCTHAALIGYIACVAPSQLIGMDNQQGPRG
jgi:hypothetical protein